MGPVLSGSHCVSMEVGIGTRAQDDPLSVINPAYVMGPVLSGSHRVSMEEGIGTRAQKTHFPLSTLPMLWDQF